MEVCCFVRMIKLILVRPLLNLIRPSGTFSFKKGEGKRNGNSYSKLELSGLLLIFKVIEDNCLLVSGIETWPSSVQMRFFRASL